MIDQLIRVWQDFLDSLDTGGGHLLLLSVFAIIFAHVPALDKYEGELIGALLMGLKVAGSNKTRRDTPTPTKTITATTETTASVADVKETN